jgi:hypothetical protein
VGRAFSPLDEALGLGGGSRCSPKVLRWLVRLGGTLPFDQAAELLADLTGLVVSAATVRRLCEAVALAEAEVDRIEQEWPERLWRPPGW